MSMFGIFLVLLLTIVSTKAEGKFSTSRYYDGTLDEIQGALIDIASAKLDMEVMEGKLEQIVSASSAIFKTESYVEWAVDRCAYKNAWKLFGVSLNCPENEEITEGTS